MLRVDKLRLWFGVKLTLGAFSYIVTNRGMHAMYEKYRTAAFGRCPHVFCQGQPVLPVGLSDLPRNYTVNVFCPRCHGLFFPKSTRQANIDGAYFGTTFPHLYLMTHPVSFSFNANVICWSVAFSNPHIFFSFSGHDTVEANAKLRTTGLWFQSSPIQFILQKPRGWTPGFTNRERPAESSFTTTARAKVMSEGH